MNFLLRGLPIMALSATLTLQAGISFEQTVSRAIQVSHDNQRPLMLLFVSKDCAACPSIQAYLEGDEIKEAVARRYVAARVDIEDFDGQACSEIYDIAEVPALIIVDSKGTIMYKAQGQISIEELASMIEDKAKIAEHPEDLAIPESEVETPDPSTQHDKKPIEITLNTTVPGKATQPSDKKDPVPKTVNTSPADAEKAPPVRKETLPISHQQSKSGKSYSLQLGFFSNREYAVRMQKKAEQSGLTGVQIHPVVRNGQEFFRVLFGDYPTAQAADLSSASLKESGFDVKVHRNRM